MPSANVQKLKEARSELAKLIKEKSCGPILIRLAWHDAGTYDDSIGKDKWPKCGGSNGSIRFDPEIKHAANAGLPNALALVEHLSEKYPEVGYADMFQLAGATAVEEMGGPKVPMRYGRTDATGPDMCHPEGNLPGYKAPFPEGGDAAKHLRHVFHRMGLSDKDIVALSGAHAVGRAHANRSGANHKAETKYTKADACPPGTTAPGGASWTPEWIKFDNSYFKLLIDRPDDENLMVLETDAVLLTDGSFKPYAEEYAKDEAKFFKDYAESHAKLSELGVKWDGEPTPLET